MSFGHAGTIVEGKEDTAGEKIARLAEAGIVVAEEISDIPGLVKERIGVRASAAGVGASVSDGSSGGEA
jgi:succinyl-CoA synthetase alpha subunit